jgi:uncharacterized RDD family membrane protein YckC
MEPHQQSVAPPGWLPPRSPSLPAPASAAPTAVTGAPDAAMRGRVNAAIADQLLLCVLGAVAGALLAPAAGTATAVVLLIAAWLVAVTVFEANGGQTPGKRWAGVRVVARDGGPITARQALVRNAARVLDAVPALYASGLITMLVTGARRQRIGDVLAGTQVVPAGGAARTLRSSRALLPALTAVAVLVSVGGVALKATERPAAPAADSAPFTDAGALLAFQACAARHVPATGTFAAPQVRRLATALLADPSQPVLPPELRARLAPCARLVR